jgi:hypothetical protein
MLLEKFRSSGMEGSIMDVYQAYGQGVDLVDEHLRAQNQGQPATLTTPEEQQQGLRPYHDAGELNKTAVFKDVPPNTPFNTHGMKAPINIDKYSQDGHLIESHKSVPPGISNIPTGPYHGDVIETPADGYQTGGFVDRKQTGGFKYTPSEAEAEQSDNTRINIPGLPQQRITPIKPNMPGYDAHFGKTYEIHKNTASADISKAENYEREGTVSQTPPSVFDFVDKPQTFNVPIIDEETGKVKDSDYHTKGASETSYNPIQRFKNNLAENLHPYNYDNSISQVWDAGVLGNPSAFRDPSMSDNQDYVGYQEGEDSYRDERIDLLHMLMGKEQITNSIEESIYKPTDSENKDAKYYKSKTTERDIVMDLYRANGSAYPPYEGDTTTLIDLINKIPSEKGKSKHVHNNILNTYQLSRGEDKKGSYIAYYDKWDVNPFKKYNKTLGDLSDFVTEDILKLTPPEIYGRIYYDKKTGEFLNTEEQRKKAEGILNDRNYQKQTKSNPYFKHNLQTGGVRRSGKVVRKQKGGEHYDVRRAEKRQRQGYDLYDEETKHWSSVDPKTGKFLKGSKHPTIDKEVDWYNSEKGANFKINNRLVTHNILGKEKKYYKYEPRTLEQEKNKPFKRQLRKAFGLNPLNKRQQKKFEGYSKDVSEVNEASSLLDAKAERERMLNRSEVERSQRDHYEILSMIAPGGTVTQEMLNDPAYKDLPDYKRAQEERYSKNKKQRGGMVENPSMDGFDSIKEREEWRESKLKLMQDKQDAGLEHGARHIWDDDYRFTPPPEDEKDNWVALPSRYPEWKRIKRIPPKKLKSKKIPTISEAREPKELQESNVSLYKGPKHPTKRVMKYSNKVRTNQIPSHDMVWNNKKNKYVKRNVEKEEVDRYKKENRFRTPTRIEANFKTGGTKYPSKKK